MGINERLRKVRAEALLTQEAFGAKGGVRKQAQLLYESGDREPDTTYLVRIQAAGFDVPYILTGIETAVDVLKLYTAAAQHTLAQKLGQASEQALVQGLHDQAKETLAQREQEAALVQRFRGLSADSKAALLSVASSLK